MGIVEWAGGERKLTPSVSVLVGDANGSYPSGNSLLVRGSAEGALIDPSVTVVAKGGAPAPVDIVINSHAHEDHLAGNGLFADATIHIHDEDRLGAVSLEGLLDVYGLTSPVREQFSTTILEEFHYAPRPDAKGFTDGHRFDLGGVAIVAHHLPGHTRGHSGFLVDDDVFFLSDIDLTGFGPYYGDVWSDLEDFEESLRKVRDIDVAWYVTFHHKGVIEGRAAFLELLDGFHAVIDRRHRAMLEYLAEPRTLDDMADHRFVYRPHVEHTFTRQVEHRTAELHVKRMLARGEAAEIEPGRFQRT
jgi:glyoxylase-like metal-dependent hydrolase (beta-lactamase superfamily II)